MEGLFPFYKRNKLKFRSQLRIHNRQAVEQDSNLGFTKNQIFLSHYTDSTYQTPLGMLPDRIFLDSIKCMELLQFGLYCVNHTKTIRENSNENDTLLSLFHFNSSTMPNMIEYLNYIYLNYYYYRIKTCIYHQDVIKCF